MKRSLPFALAFCLVGTNAFAITIDFTDSLFNPFGANSITKTVGGITATVEAIQPTGASLFWTGSGSPDASRFFDGFGINSTSYEADEIEGVDTLRVSFLSDVLLSEIGITNLFKEGSPSYLETGSYSLNEGAYVAFFADPSQSPSPASNGELLLTFPQISVQSIDFMAPGITYVNGHKQNHEFSVAFVTVSSVPLPSSLLLFATGLVVLTTLLRWRNSGDRKSH